MKKDLIDAYNAGYQDAQCNHVNDAENYAEEANYLYDKHILPTARLIEKWDQAPKANRQITDEEIEKAAWAYNGRKNLDIEFIRAAFINGAKWMREQLKTK